MLEFINVQNFMKKYHSDQKFLKKLLKIRKFSTLRNKIKNKLKISLTFDQKVLERKQKLILKAYNLLFKYRLKKLLIIMLFGWDKLPLYQSVE